MRLMVDQMLAKSPEDRPTAQDLIDWVEGLLPNVEPMYRIKLNLDPSLTEEETKTVAIAEPSMRAMA